MEAEAHFDGVVGDSEGELGVGTVLKDGRLFVDCGDYLAEGKKGEVGDVFGGSGARRRLKSGDYKKG